MWLQPDLLRLQGDGTGGWVSVRAGGDEQEGLGCGTGTAHAHPGRACETAEDRISSTCAIAPIAAKRIEAGTGDDCRQSPCGYVGGVVTSRRQRQDGGLTVSLRNC